MYEDKDAFCHTCNRQEFEAESIFLLRNKEKYIYKKAIDERFRMDYWPYVQNNTFALNKTMSCFSEMRLKEWLNSAQNLVFRGGLVITLLTLL